MSGLLTEAGAGQFEVHALVNKHEPSRITLRLRRVAPTPNRTIFEINAYHLNHANGMVAGLGTPASGSPGLVMVRH